MARLLLLTRDLHARRHPRPIAAARPWRPELPRSASRTAEKIPNRPDIQPPPLPLDDPVPGPDMVPPVREPDVVPVPGDIPGNPIQEPPHDLMG